MTVIAEDLAATTNVDGSTAQTIAPRLREHLRKVAEQRLPVTYQEVAKSLGLTPPNTIYPVTEALEHLMTEDAATDRPFHRGHRHQQGAGWPAGAGILRLCHAPGALRRRCGRAGSLGFPRRGVQRHGRVLGGERGPW